MLDEAHDSSLIQRFSTLLKGWRAKCGVSRLDMSLRSDFPQKHINFLELARTTTSRGMVMRIGVPRGLQLHDRNSPLLAAGFAPTYK